MTATQEQAVPAVQSQPAVQPAPVATLAVVVSRINKNANGNRQGYLDITINGVLSIKGFKVFTGANGQFVSPPAHKDKTSGKFYPDVFIAKGVEYDNFQAVCLAAFNDPNWVQPAR